MLSKTQRLRDPKRFRQLFSRGTWARGRWFSLVCLPSRGGSTVGFVVTKKVTKSAVARNRVKRRLRAIFRELLRQPTRLKTLDCVVVVHRLGDELAHPALVAEVNRLVAQLAAGRG